MLESYVKQTDVRPSQEKQGQEEKGYEKRHSASASISRYSHRRDNHPVDQAQEGRNKGNRIQDAQAQSHQARSKHFNKGIHLSPALFAEAFPFHMAIDWDMRVTQIGHSLAKLCPNLRLKDDLRDHFDLLHEDDVDYESLISSASTPLLLSLVDRPDVWLRGQLLVDEDNMQLLFVGAPQVFSEDEMQRTGISADDFALHDNTPQLLLELGANLHERESVDEQLELLEEEREQALSILESTGEALILTSSEGRIVFMNEAAEHLTGQNSTAVNGRPLRDVFKVLDAVSRQSLVEWLTVEAITGMQRLPEEAILRASNREIAISGLIAPINAVDGSRDGLVISFHDVTEERSKNSLLKYQATHGQLTRLPNRMMLFNRIDRALSESRDASNFTALLYLDLDNFRRVNDSHGHVVGDQVLQIIGKRLAESVRHTDFVSHPGGDEFAVLLTAIKDRRFLENVGQKILSVFSTPVEVGGKQITIGASIGISVFPDHSDSSEELMRCADIAMYQAKDDGGAAYRFYEPKTVMLDDGLRFAVADLKRALEENQLDMHYQPKVESESGLVVGYEALMRWNHPELGNIPPAEFFPVAEEAGLDGALGDWALKTACGQARALKHLNAALGQEYSVAVNISARQLYEGDLVTRVSRILAQERLEPRILELEFTEASLLRDADAAVAKLTALRELGVRLSIDDFGTGYSSLNYLQRFPVNTVKIDRSFLSDIGEEKSNIAIIRIIINLCKTLGLEIVAEGVESQLQRRILSKMGCKYIQGHLFYPALSADELFKLMTKPDRISTNPVRSKAV